MRFSTSNKFRSTEFLAQKAPSFDINQMLRWRGVLVGGPATRPDDPGWISRSGQAWTMEEKRRHRDVQSSAPPLAEGPS